MNKKRAVLIVLAVVLLLSISACSSKITSGGVVKKSFTPAHNEVRFIPIVVSNGKSVMTTIVPYLYRYSDRWEITISAWDEKEKKMQTATYRVNEGVYESVKIGDEFVYKKDMQPIEPEYTREKQKEANQ